MKKRYIALIVASSAVLLFGSLVYCAISAFPELLLSEEEKKERLKQAEEEEHHYLVEIDDVRGDAYLFHEDKNEEAPESAPVVFNNEPVDVTPEAYDDVEFITIDAPVTQAIEIITVEETKVSVTQNDELLAPIDLAPATFDFEISSVSDELVEDKVEVIEEVVEEEAEAIDVIDYAVENNVGLSAAMEPVAVFESEEIVEENIVIERKEKNTNEQYSTSHNKVLECTLLVIGAVDILSFLLIKKRKRLSHF